MKTDLGEIKVFCKAVKKAKLSEGDVSKFFAKSKRYQTPTIILYDGELSKKAKDLIKNFENFNLEKIV